jgi:hypothetical protein
MKDFAGNKVVNFGPSNIADAAGPIPISATISKPLSANNLQSAAVLEVTFSEPVTGTGVAGTDWKFSRNGTEALSTSNWPDGSTIAYAAGSTTSKLKMTLTGDTTSGWWVTGARMNLVADDTASITDQSVAPNLADANDSNFGISGLTGPAVDAVAVTATTATTATISWVTLSNTTSNQIQYGTTTALGTTSTAGTPGESGTTHSINLSALTANTLYYYKACSTNSSQTCSPIYNFTTPVTTPSSGISVNSITMVKTYATADDTYANGWKWAINISVWNTAETSMKLQLSDWVSGANTIAIAANTRIGLTNEATGATNSTIIAATNAIGNAYTDQATALTLVDENVTSVGLQDTIYVYSKVPTTASGGAYTSSYGIYTY